MSEPEITLYVDGFFISPYALSAFVALEEKGLAYRLETVALEKKQHHDAGYRAHTGRVPSLRHGDYWLAESSAIAEYLEDRFPAPGHPRLYPQDIQARGLCRELQAWLRSDLMPIREERATATIWYQHADQPLSTAAQAAAARLLRTCDALVGEGQTSLFGDWCIADTDLAMMLRRLHANGDALPPRLVAFLEAQWSRPSARKWDAMKRAPYVAY